MENLVTRNSDHSALYLGFGAGRVRNGGSRSFRFEMAWLLDEGCRGVVEGAWEDGKVDGLLHCLHHCGRGCEGGVAIIFISSGRRSSVCGGTSCLCVGIGILLPWLSTSILKTS